MQLSDVINEVWASRFSVKSPVEKDICNFDIFVKDEYYPVGSSGGMGLWTGRQKSRKTFALNCTIGSAIKGEAVGPFRYKPNGGIILHFDTEQPRNRYLIGQRKMYSIAGFDLSTDQDRYFSFNLRKYDWQTRVKIVNQIIMEMLKDGMTIDLLCIDGIVDLCENFNENTSARDTTQKVMAWGEATGASIYQVLHTNKSGGEVRGHLGTELSNKTDFTLEVKKKEDDDIFSTVQCKDTRFFPFPKFELYQTRDGSIDMETGGWISDDVYLKQQEEEMGAPLPF